MRSFVHERRELGVGPAHQQEGNQPRDGMVEPDRGDDDADRLRVEGEHQECVPRVRYSPQFVAESRHGPGGRRDAVGGGELGEHLRFGKHRERHARILHWSDGCFQIVMTRCFRSRRAH